MLLLSVNVVGDIDDLVLMRSLNVVVVVVVVTVMDAVVMVVVVVVSYGVVLHRAAFSVQMPGVQPCRFGAE